MSELETPIEAASAVTTRALALLTLFDVGTEPTAYETTRRELARELLGLKISDPTPSLSISEVEELLSQISEPQNLSVVADNPIDGGFVPVVAPDAPAEPRTAGELITGDGRGEEATDPPEDLTQGVDVGTESATLPTTDSFPEAPPGHTPKDLEEVISSTLPVLPTNNPEVQQNSNRFVYIVHNLFNPQALPVEAQDVSIITYLFSGHRNAAEFIQWIDQRLLEQGGLIHQH